jgi:predicted metal-binding membrane protein
VSPALSRPERFAATALLLIFPLACWAWIVVMARDMYGPMTGASAWMMTPHWDGAHLLLLWLMWAVMMAGMMLPTATPMVLAYAAIARRTAQTAAAARIAAIVAGYLTVWIIFSVGATVLQRLLARALVLTPMMELTRTAGGVLLLIAGAYQATPLKQTCLRWCQSPAGFLLTRWRNGIGGTWRMGAEHGVACVGCCWALMLLLFAGGVMNLAVIAALTAFVAFEKLAPIGRLGEWISGAALATIGLRMIAR